VASNLGSCEQNEPAARVMNWTLEGIDAWLLIDEATKEDVERPDNRMDPFSAEARAVTVAPSRAGISTGRNIAKHEAQRRRRRIKIYDGQKLRSDCRSIAHRIC
jgi:hypothetical protein